MRLHPARKNPHTAVATHPVQRPQITARRTLQQMIDRQRVKALMNQKRRHRVARAKLFVGCRFARTTQHATRNTWLSRSG